MRGPPPKRVRLAHLVHRRALIPGLVAARSVGHGDDGRVFDADGNVLGTFTPLEATASTTAEMNSLTPERHADGQADSTPQQQVTFSLGNTAGSDGMSCVCRVCGDHVFLRDFVLWEVGRTCLDRFGRVC